MIHMKRKTFVKVLLDVLMAILFIAVMNVRGTGLAFHEIAGLGLFGLMAAHLALNWKWVCTVSHNLFNSKISSKAKWMAALNLAMLISMILIGLSGVMISEVIFGFGSSGTPAALYRLHEWASYLCLGLCGLHLVLHRHYLWNTLRAMLLPAGGNKIVWAMKSIGAAGLVLAILYNLVFPDLDTAAVQMAASNSSTAISSKKESSEVISESITNEAQAQPADAVTLSDYLSGFFCTGCHNHCPLSNPRCGRADAQIEEYTQKYQALYGSSEA
jgi:cytochrome c5